MDYNEVEGNLIELALEGKFDVIAHGCNCWNTMGAGIAPQMAKAFACDNYSLEVRDLAGAVDKLGRICYGSFYTKQGEEVYAYRVDKTNGRLESEGWKKNIAINCYTQYGPGLSHRVEATHPLSYPALILCLQKINFTFKGKHIGLPLIGCGLAGGNWEDVKGLIQKYLTDMKVTIVHYKPEENGIDTGGTQVQEVDNGNRGEQQQVL